MAGLRGRAECNNPSSAGWAPEPDCTPPARTEGNADELGSAPMGNKQAVPAGPHDARQAQPGGPMQVGPAETTGPRPVTAMRIVIRGARGAGKTSLLQRLQGNKWSERYVATPEIGIAHISWSYKTRDDIVKVSSLLRWRAFRAAPASPEAGARGKASERPRARCGGRNHSPASAAACGSAAVLAPAMRLASARRGCPPRLPPAYPAPP